AGEELLEVPGVVAVLDEVQIRVLDRHAMDQDPVVDEVSRVVFECHETRAREQLAATVANLDAVDGQLAEKIPAQVSDVDRAAALARASDERLHDRRSQPLATLIAARDEQHPGHDDQSEEDEYASRDQSDETAALHARIRNSFRSRRSWSVG